MIHDPARDRAFLRFVRIILVRPELPEVITGLLFNGDEDDFILHLMIDVIADRIVVGALVEGKPQGSTRVSKKYNGLKIIIYIHKHFY